MSRSPIRPSSSSLSRSRMGEKPPGLHVATQPGEISPSPTIEMPGCRGAQRPPVPVSPVEEIVLTGLPWSAPVGYLVLLESSLFQPADGPFVHEGLKILVDGFDLTTIEATSKRRSRFIDESVAAQMLRLEADRVLEIDFHRSRVCPGIAKIRSRDSLLMPDSLSQATPARPWPDHEVAEGSRGAVDRMIEHRGSLD